MSLFASTWKKTHRELARVFGRFHQSNCKFVILMYQYISGSLVRFSFFRFFFVKIFYLENDVTPSQWRGSKVNVHLCFRQCDRRVRTKKQWNAEFWHFYIALYCEPIDSRVFFSFAWFHICSILVQSIQFRLDKTWRNVSPFINRPAQKKFIPEALFKLIVKLCFCRATQNASHKTSNENLFIGDAVLLP